jgi:hypothetical protein
MRGLWFISVSLCACATVPVRETEEAEALTPPPLVTASLALGDRIAGHADALVGIASLKTVTSNLPDDCTGLVRYAYEREGVELMPDVAPRGSNGVTAIWFGARERGALHQGRPSPGDLIFFHETYDRNRDGRLDDGLTHIGVVEGVEPDGTVVFVHRTGQGVTRSKVNPSRPLDHGVNDWLRVRARGWPAALTGELFSGYASASALVARPFAAGSR